MGRRSHRVLVLGLLGSCLAGCANNPIMLQNQVRTLQQQQTTLAQQNQELTTRASTLDEDNQELSSMLAQAKQESQLLDNQLTALREQLGDTAAQLAAVRADSLRTSERSNALAASLRNRGGAEITANSSLRGDVPLVDLPGVEVRHDGDVIRIELPGNRLFAPGSARLLPDAATLIEQVADEVSRIYPNQIIGVEGHTDSDPIQSSDWQNNHQLSVGRAMAVYDHLAARTRLGADQLFVVGHGENHPVVSNATPAGKERNRRVELVVYPEQTGER